MKNEKKVFWIVSITFLLIPPGAVDTSPRHRHGARRGSRRGHDTDFNEFMANMFWNYPQKSVLKEQKTGPNVGHRPYWWGYEYGVNKYVYDYGLNDLGTELWRIPNKTLMGTSDILGAGTLVDHDMPETKQNLNCYRNMGETCVLGPGPLEYTAENLAKYIERTTKCDDLCTPYKKKKGLVCVSQGEVMQEMHFCVYEKMNCLGGIAVVQCNGNGWYYGDRQKVPFALKPNWGRISIMGRRSHVRFTNSFLGDTGEPFHSYWFVLSVGFDLHDVVWCDDASWFWCWYFAAAFTTWPYSLKEHEWTEYSFVWEGGPFLMSQPRHPDTWNQWWMELERNPIWDIKYVDVASESYYYPRFILHDLPYDLNFIKDGRCRLDPLYLPRDTKEVNDDADYYERAYQNRIREATIDPLKLAAENVYVEY